MAKGPRTVADQWQRRELRMRIRMAIVAVGLMLGFGLVIMRGVQLQIYKDVNLAQVAKKQYQAVVPVAPRRGKILDVRGKELAVSTPVISIYADARTMSDVAESIQKLNHILNLGSEAEGIRSRLQSGKRFVWIKRQVPLGTVEQVKASNIQGLNFVEESRRFYPSGKLASNVLGAVGKDSDSLAGLELAYEKTLLSKQNKMVFQRDARGHAIYTPAGFKEQNDVNNVTLTIDKTVQFIAESALDKAVLESKAKAGVVVVMDPKTGAILAMASSPNFNPNDYGKYPQAMWRNRATSDAFEPGSTFKVLTVAAALDQGLVKPDQMFDCNRGAIQIGSATIHDHDPYGMLSVRDIIKVSSNIGAYKVAAVMGKENLYNSLRKFGIGQKTEVDYPGELTGTLHAFSRWSPVELATVSFGQGVTATPLQIVTAMATIGNGGTRMKPYLVQRIETERGEVVYDAQPTAVATAIAPATATLMLDVMRSVVGQGGTAKKAASDEFCVAGKTGTAQKVDEGTRKYSTGKFFASFVGVSPCEVPRLAVFVGIDEPQGGHFGGQIAGPVFREIVDATLHYLSVPGKNTPVIVMPETEVPTQLAAEKQMAVIDKKTEKQNRKVAADIFAAANPEMDQITMPDMSGWTMRQVVASLRPVQAEVSLEGGGRVVEQAPAAGVMVKRGDVVKVRFQLPQ